MYVLSMLIHVCSCIYIHVYAFYPFSPSSSSGLPMNQIEMEKIADGFDANRTGLIDLSQIMAILKGQKPRARFVPSAGPARALSDSEKIDLEVQEIFYYFNTI